ncbi:MAG: hypothetical protein H6Q72_932 [Firmicutes bacterium]|nr:hypothetical protein [Bacillota bacterium]
MEYGNVPLQYLKADCLEPEAEYAKQSLDYTTRTATPADIAKIEAAIAGKMPNLTYSISAEIGCKAAPEKIDLPFEEMGRKKKGEEVQYRPRFYDRAG